MTQDLTMDEIPEADVAGLDENVGADEDFDYEMDAVGKEVKITADGGVIKKMLAEGSGWQTPEPGDEVYVHYVGTLEDGTKFDSSRDRDQPFTFTIGQGRVIKGWDLGVAKMKKGEKSLLICKSDYAYGKSGSPPTIPPDATLNFEVELLSWKSVKDISNDGGVIKTIQIEGKGYDHPKPRDEVLVKYTARLKGSDAPFAETAEEGVEFVVEAGHLCKALPVAVKTMQKGEKVRLDVKPDYGFGDGSKEPDVPKDADVEIDLELVSWKSVEDVTPDGGVVKKTLAEGSAWTKPNQGAEVKICYKAMLPDGTVFDERAQGNELDFVVDEEQIIEGLEMAIQKMKEGEKALVTIAPKYAFGAAGSTATGVPVPPDTTVQYEVELVSFKNAKESWSMSDEEKVEAAGKLKDKGNKAYKESKLPRAVRLYEKAAELLSNDKNMADMLRHACKDITKSVSLNLAAAHLKEHKWLDARKSCDKVLELDPTSVKALYRRAQAQIGLQDYVEAEIAIKRGLDVEPSNPDLNTLYKRLKVLMKAQNKQEAALYSKMFSKPLHNGAANGHKGVDKMETEVRPEPAAIADDAGPSGREV